jgi:hypothetical protein
LPCTAAGASYSGLSEGGYRFEVQAIDPSTGALSGLGAGWYFRVDDTGPSVAFSSAPSINTRRESAVFRFTPLERIAGSPSCTLDGRSVDCAHDRLDLPNVSRGSHTLVVTAKDPLGNVGATTYDWLVDRTPPDALFKSGPGHLSNQRDARFDVGSTVDPQLFICTLDDGPTMPCFTAPELNGVKDGKHTLTVWAVDLAGNRSAPARYTWTVDATPPQLVLFEGPQSDEVTSSHSATFKVAADEPSHLFCSIDGAAFAACSSTAHYDGLASGAHTFQVYGEDRAGNKSATIARSWTIS